MRIHSQSCFFSVLGWKLILIIPSFEVIRNIEQKDNNRVTKAILYRQRAASFN